MRLPGCVSLSDAGKPKRMALHLIKLSVGAEGVDDVPAWMVKRVAMKERRRWGTVHDHMTRMFPSREMELLGGGSLYRVVVGMARLRQHLVGFRPVVGEDEIERCATLLSPELVMVEPRPRRASQGWRYLKQEDAPRDLCGAGKGGGGGFAPHARFPKLGLV